MLSEKLKKIHALHNLGVKKKKGKHRCCFEAHSKAVTFHTITSLWVVFSLSTLYFKLNFLCESFDRFLFLDAHANFDTCPNKKKTLKNDYHFASREGKSRTPDMLLLLHETSTQRAGKYYPRENRFVPKITLEGLQWLEGLYGGLILSAPLSSLDYMAFVHLLKSL